MKLLLNAFSCHCAGMIAPGEQQVCDCYSQLEVGERRYRMEYMKNTSPNLSTDMPIESFKLINC